MFLYENHMGGLFFMEEELDWEDLYCETCGDTDFPLGECSTREEALDLIAAEGRPYGRYDPEYVKELLDETFGSAAGSGDTHTEEQKEKKEAGEDA